ncbi:MAG: DNA repair protein RecO [Pseudomonadota bacterium]
MEWTDRAIVLANRPHGENHSIATVFTAQHGAASGLVHGGQGKSKGPLLQAGNGVEVTWRARAENALGHFALELSMPRAASAMADRQALMSLTMVTDLLYTVLPEGEAYLPLYEATVALLDHLEAQPIWPVLLVKWELGLLDALGFGLTLDRCVATGRMLEDGATLTFVSPKSGGAVSYEAGLPYKEKMLPLPPFIIDQGDPTCQDVRVGLELTAYFLTERLLAPTGKELPDVRDRYIRRTLR